MRWPETGAAGLSQLRGFGRVGADLERASGFFALTLSADFPSPPWNVCMSNMPVLLGDNATSYLLS